MAISNYEYSIDADFPNHWVDLGKLNKQIRDTLTTITLIGSHTNGDICNLLFARSLTEDEQASLGSLIALHDGQALPVEQPIIKTVATDRVKNASGIPVTSPTFFTSEYGWRMEGIRFAVSGHSTGIYDFKITKELLMQGGLWWVQTTGNADRASFSIMDKDNTLGLHTIYGLPPGYPIELKKFVKNYSIPPGVNNGSITAPTVSPVVSGLYIRTTYDNEGDDGAIIGVNYVWYETT